jgi:hypothetical protein
MPWTIRYFVESDGAMPAERFEDSLPDKVQGRLFGFIKQVAENEGRIGGRIFRKCFGYSDLWEVRARVGKQLVRMLCTRDGDNLILLGGVLKGVDEETPRSALAEASDRLSRYKVTKLANPPFQD